MRVFRVLEMACAFPDLPLAQHPAAEGAELKILWGEPVSEKKKEDDDRSLHLSLRLDSITRMFSSTKLVPPKLKRKSHFLAQCQQLSPLLLLQVVCNSGPTHLLNTTC